MDGQTDGKTDRQTDGTENLPILQDFVPYPGRCPASPQKDQRKTKVKQGKGTADHLMPLGNWFFSSFSPYQGRCPACPEKQF